jgi:hypothetical protein
VNKNKVVLKIPETAKKSAVGRHHSDPIFCLYSLQDGC